MERFKSGVEPFSTWFGAAKNGRRHLCHSVEIRSHQRGERVWLHGSVNIGGKDYLLLNDRRRADDELIVVRAMDKNRFVAMDCDRFSSLSNALSLY